MATVRRKGKSSKKTANRSPRKEDDTVMTDSLNDTTGDEENDSDQPDRGQSPFSNMSLDVLAQVASETLEKEPRGGQRQSPRRLTRRSVQSRDHLNLTQIKALSSKSLVDFFSEPRADEIKRNYTFVCYLMPENCQEQFSSFGNDSRARLSMKNHLHHHLKELSVAEENEGETFHAEPMPARRRRLAEAAKRNKKAFTSIKTKSKPDILILPKGKLISLSELANANRSSEESSPSKRKFRVEQDEGDNLENASPVNDDDGNPVSKRRAGEDYMKTKTQKKMTRFHGKQTGPSSGSKVETHISAETERRIEENEQFIVDLLARTQPHMDHCYTTIFGKKRGTDAAQLEMELSSGEEEEELSSGEEEITVDVGDSSSYYGSFYAQTQRIAEPILLFRRTPGWEETPMVCCEEVIGREELEGEGETDEPHNGEKPYPPMPKSALAKKGRIPVPEENVSFSEEEELTLSPKRRRKSTLKEGSVEWERKRALRCIRELKAKRREDSSSVPLVCKICKDKTFTACATLMYHYRSHAGIKPFVCLICNTTFTRQHSLNYHMLIHNNQSRFTCKDCGRKFRHPSHFKEHLRRHTGETPFQCMDCSQKFKTRNTYKRHLKTRHGKLLTAAGIQMLSREEFLLVRTKPYRNREESEEEDIPEEDLVDSGEDTVADINFTAPSDSAVPVLPVITQTTDNLPLQLTAEQLSAPALHGHVLPVSSGHYLVPVDLQFIMSS